MNLNDVTALAQAGFTKEDIIKIFTAVQQVQQMPTQPVQQVQQMPTQPVQNSPFETMLAAMTGKIDDLTRTVQTANIMRSQQPSPANTFDDVMAEIIGANAKEDNNNGK